MQQQKKTMSKHLHDGLEFLFEKCVRIHSITMDVNNETWCTLETLNLMKQRLLPTRFNQLKFVVSSLTLLRAATLTAKNFESFLVGVVSSLPQGQCLLPFGRLRVCGVQFDSRQVVISNPTIHASLSSLIDFNCTPMTLMFTNINQGRKRLVPISSLRSQWLRHDPMQNMSFSRLRRLSLFQLPMLTMKGIENVLEKCTFLTSLSLAGTRLTHTALLSTVTKLVGKRLEVLNLCGSVQLNVKLLTEIGTFC
jgi:hypothetical protein